MRVSRRRLRRALATKLAIRELLDSESRTYPTLTTAAEAGLIEPRTPAAIADLSFYIADEFVKALPDRDSLQVHISREVGRARAEFRDALPKLDADARRRPARSGNADTAGGEGENNLHLVPRSSDLIARDDIQEACDNVFSRERLLVLVGPHGCGKSVVAGQLALSSAAKSRWWIDGHSDEALQLGAERLLAALGRSDDGSASGRLRLLLAEDPDLLVVLDGVDDPVRIQPLLPFNLRSNVIVTTTNPNLAPPSSSVSVGPFTTQQSVALFERLLAGLPVENPEDVERLVVSLSGLPLAVRQAAAYMRASGVSASKMRARLGRSSRSVLVEHVPTDYPQSLVTVHDLAKEDAVQREPRAAEVLAIIAMSGPGGLTNQVLEALSSAHEVDRALSVLSRNGLVQVSFGRAACHSITARLEVETTRSRRRRHLTRQAIRYSTSSPTRASLEYAEVTLPAISAMFPHAQYHWKKELKFRSAALALAMKVEHPQSIVEHTDAIRLLTLGKRKYRGELLEVLLVEAGNLLMLGAPGRALPRATEAICLAAELNRPADHAEALSAASLCNLQLGNRVERLSWPSVQPRFRTT